MLKIASGVLSRKGNGAAAAQMELFREFSLPCSICIGKIDGVDFYKATETVTIREIKKSLSVRTPKSLPKRDVERERLLAELEPFAVSQDSTIVECWEVKRKSA